MEHTITGTDYSSGKKNKSSPVRAPRIPFYVPLPFIQPALSRLALRIARQHPRLFSRLGRHCNKSFLINPVNLPFMLLLHPRPEAPLLRAHRRTAQPEHDACIAGSLLSLFDMIDGRLDGDALFFSRNLTIEGDVEAVVALRNALDDLDGSIADDLANAFGPAGRLALALLRRRGKNEHPTQEA